MFSIIHCRHQITGNEVYSVGFANDNAVYVWEGLHGYEAKYTMHKRSKLEKQLD